VAASMSNARSETASTKPAFREALKSRGCLIPADGFYEWVGTGKGKQPYCFEVNEGELFASQDCGIAGGTQLVTGSSPVRS
jgi:putative SOS response-associated peptidase YedK